MHFPLARATTETPSPLHTETIDSKPSPGKSKKSKNQGMEVKVKAATTAIIRSFSVATSTKAQKKTTLDPDHHPQAEDFICFLFA